ncbi:MAG TPA: hypothetical protein VK211_19780 [Kamptonema sp.]|nr:hypothetical protein [Kamptonema sp.]
MKTGEFFSSIAATVLIAGMALTGISSSAMAADVQNNESVDGVIRSNSPTYRFRNMWSPNTPTEQLRGQEYTFSAESGDEIQINLDIDRNGFSPVLVLFHTETNKQVAYSQSNSFSYRIPRSGEYKLLVLAKDTSRSGRYTLEISGISDDRDRSSRDRDRDRDRNRDREYNNSDDREQFLKDEFGLRPLDCRSRRTMVRVTFQDGDESTQCAEPTRAIPAGDYYYNSRTRDLESTTAEDPRERCRVAVGGVCISR